MSRVEIMFVVSSSSGSVISGGAGGRVKPDAAVSLTYTIDTDCLPAVSPGG